MIIYNFSKFQSPFSSVLLHRQQDNRIFVIPADVGIHLRDWIPDQSGMTTLNVFNCRDNNKWNLLSPVLSILPRILYDDESKPWHLFSHSLFYCRTLNLDEIKIMNILLLQDTEKI